MCLFREKALEFIRSCLETETAQIGLLASYGLDVSRVTMAIFSQKRFFLTHRTAPREGDSVSKI